MRLENTTYGDLLEVVTELDDGCSTEFSRFVHCQYTVLQVVKFRLDEQKIAIGQLGFTYAGYITYEQDLTGKNRERGTLIPMALSKCCKSASVYGSICAD